MQDNLKRAVQLLAGAAALLQANGSGWLRALVPRTAHDDVLLAGLRSRGIKVAIVSNCDEQGRGLLDWLG